MLILLNKLLKKQQKRILEGVVEKNYNKKGCLENEGTFWFISPKYGDFAKRAIFILILHFSLLVLNSYF